LVIAEVPTVITSGGSTFTSSVLTTAHDTASIATLITTTNSLGQAITTSTTVPAIVLSVTNAAGSIVLTTSAVVASVPSSYAAITTTDKFGNQLILTSVTAGQVLTTTDARGEAITTTFYPPGGAVESVIFQTTQLPDGQQVVETLTAYVAPSGVGLATAALAATASPTSTGKPSLQSAGAAAGGKGVSEGLLGLAVAGAAGLVVLL